jgi:hypothetical protein
MSKPMVHILTNAYLYNIYKTKLISVVLVCERTMPTEQQPLVGEVVPTFADCVVSATDSHSR